MRVAPKLVQTYHLSVSPLWFWRGMLMPWLQEDWQQLMQRHSQHGLPHASLFTGSEGYGKRQLAYKLAFFLLCQDKNKVDRPCGQCHSCQLMKAGTHPDYWVMNNEYDE